MQLEGDECLQNAISSDSEATRNCARASLVASHGVVGLVGRTSDGCTYALGVLASHVASTSVARPLKGRVDPPLTNSNAFHFHTVMQSFYSHPT